jgi:hypothetical protein
LAINSENAEVALAMKSGNRGYILSEGGEGGSRRWIWKEDGDGGKKSKEIVDKTGGEWAMGLLGAT